MDAQEMAGRVASALDIQERVRVYLGFDPEDGSAGNIEAGLKAKTELQVREAVKAERVRVLTGVARGLVRDSGAALTLDPNSDGNIVEAVRLAVNALLGGIMAEIVDQVYHATAGHVRLRRDVADRAGLVASVVNGFVALRSVTRPAPCVEARSAPATGTVRERAIREHAIQDCARVVRSAWGKPGPANSVDLQSFETLVHGIKQAVEQDAAKGSGEWLFGAVVRAELFRVRDEAAKAFGSARRALDEAMKAEQVGVADTGSDLATLSAKAAREFQDALAGLLRAQASVDDFEAAVKRVR